MNSLKQHLQKGFTLVEMMVVAPIVILLIGAFIALIVNLTGEVMSSRGSNVLAYDLQNALNRIEQDVKLSTTYLSVTNIDVSTTKQGYGGTTTTGSTTAFTNVDKTGTGGSSASLILNALVTSGNPLSTNAGIVYLANTPNSCSDYDEYSKNTPMTMNIVYFVKDNTLWRRVIMPSNYTNASIRCGAAPWQIPSCINGYSPTSLTFCKSNDERMADGVNPSDFTFKYFASASSTSEDLVAGNQAITNDATRNTALQSTPTVQVSIKADKTIAGRDISRTSSVRVTRLDTNASSIANLAPVTAAPSAPTVSGTVSDGHNVTFTWPRVAGATSYDLSYCVVASTVVDPVTHCTSNNLWQVGENNIDNNSRSYTVTDGGHTDKVAVRVLSRNSFGPSGYGTQAITIPLWAPILLKGNWTDYAQGYSYAAYTKTKSGLVMFRGLVKNSGTPVQYEILGKIPEDYAPTGNLIFGTITGNGGNDPGRIDIDSEGNVIFNAGGASWISLEPIRYAPASTSITRTAPSLLNSWVNYGGAYATATYGQLSTGRAVIQGLVKSGTTTDNTPIFNLPAALTPPLYLHMASRTTVYGGIGVSASPSALVTKANSSNGYLSLNTTYLPNTATGFTWTNLSLQNSWVAYGGSFSTPQYTKTSDNIVQLKGLIRLGSTTYDSTIATLPAGFRPKSRILYATSNYNNVHARVDIYPDGRVNFLGSSNSWLSLDAITFLAEQ